jgi:hypothetical protein
MFLEYIYPYPNFYPQYPLALPRPGPTCGESLLCTALNHACGTTTRLPLGMAYFTQHLYIVNNETGKPAPAGRKLTYGDLALQGASRVKNLLHKENKLLICGIVLLLVIVSVLASGL